jgi:hypothetical protein
MRDFDVKNEAYFTTGNGSFPGGKQPGSDADHPPHLEQRLNNRVELYVYFPSGSS